MAFSLKGAPCESTGFFTFSLGKQRPGRVVDKNPFDGFLKDSQKGRVRKR